MKKILAIFAACLLVPALASVVYGSGDSPSPAVSRPDAAGAAFSGGFTTGLPQMECNCIDVAFTGTFKARGLEYVSTPEFADAMVSVANGTSRYSPREIPPEWKTVAADWAAGRGANMTDSSHPRYSAAVYSEPCKPALLYLASMEYRARRGDRNLTPTFPVYLRQATAELESVVAAKRGMSSVYANRAAAIGTRIAEAERLGAGDCSPGELAAAKAELARVRREAVSVRASLPETEALFRRVELMANALIANRQLAARQGLYCLPE